jgi:DNA processing protein
MMKEEELFYLLLLQKIPNLGEISAKRLIQKTGSAKAVFEEKKSTLLKIDGIGRFRIDKLHDKAYRDEAEKEMDFIRKNQIIPLCFSEENYPERLKHCVDSPLVLFSKGNISLNHKHIISIVGTRKITTYGASFCKKIIEELAPWDVVIVSGLAYGVDIAAHRSAIKNKMQTIGCLAHGLNQLYPKEHEKYAREIENNGGFLTEFWSTDVFDKNNFLKRNRIIAGISEATIVIESAERGGSLVTAEIANSYNREVFAVPGRVDDKQSSGCHNLIKTQKAHLLTSAADLVYILSWERSLQKKQQIQKQLFVELDEDEKTIFNFLKENNKQHLDHIAASCNMPVHKTAALLLNMEMKGVVIAMPGRIYDLN